MSTHPLFLIVVFDGLRADMVTPETMPNLCRFQEDGTSFPNARSVYPTSTRTNAAALATGSTPRHNGIVQNKYFDPNIFHDDVFHPGQFADIAAGMAAYGGDLLTTPSLGDIAARGGYAMASFLTGGTGTSRLVNPRAAAHGRGDTAASGSPPFRPPPPPSAYRWRSERPAQGFGEAAAAGVDATATATATATVAAAAAAGASAGVSIGTVG